MIRTRMRTILANSGFIRAVGTLVSASVVGQAILVAVLPFVTRLYDPASFGLFAVFSAMLALALVASSLRYELAIPLPRSHAGAFSLLVLALLLNGVTAFLLGLVVLLWGGELATMLNSPGLQAILWLLPFSVLGAGTYRSLRLWAVRHHDFKGLAQTSIAQAVVNAASQIVCGLIGLGGAGLAISHALGQTAGAGRLARGMNARFRSIRAGQIIRIRHMASRHSRFPKFDVAAAFVDTLSVQLPNLLLAALFSPMMAGHYLLAERILGTPLSLLSQSIGQVLYAQSRQAMEEGRMAALTKRVLLGLCALIIVPVGVIAPAGEILFGLIFGEEWRIAGQFASWLVVGLGAQCLFSSVSLVLMATNGQHVNLILHLCMLLAKGAALLYGYLMGSALLAIIAFALVNLVGYLVAIVLVIWRARSFDIVAADRRQQASAKS